MSNRMYAAIVGGLELFEDVPRDADEKQRALAEAARKVKVVIAQCGLDAVLSVLQSAAEITADVVTGSDEETLREVGVSADTCRRFASLVSDLAALDSKGVA